MNENAGKARESNRRQARAALASLTAAARALAGKWRDSPAVAAADWEAMGTPPPAGRPPAAAGVGSTAARNGSVDAGVGSTAARNGSVDAGVGSIAARNGSIAERNGSIAARNGSVADRNGSIAARNGSVAARNGSVDAGVGPAARKWAKTP